MMELKNFDQVLAMVPKNRTIRAVVAGSDCENLLQAIFQAQEEGFIQPILVGDRAKTEALLEKLGLRDMKYTMVELQPDQNPSKIAVDIVKSGDADILVRGRVLAHDLLLQVMDKKDGLYDGRMISHVALASLPDYPKLLALSDMAVMVQPDLPRKKAMIKNTVDALKLLGYEDPKLALLALVEEVTFRAKDTVDAKQLVTDQERNHFVDAQLWGPISYDLVFSKTFAERKGYDCPWSGGGFDGIIAPDVTLANTLVKCWLMHGNTEVGGVLMGARVPVAFSNRGISAREHYLSLAIAAIMLDKSGK